MVLSGSAAPGSDGYKRPPGRQRLGSSGVAVPSGERATVAVFLGRASGGDRPTATLLWRAGKHRRHSRTRRAAVVHPRSGGDGGCARRGRLRQQQRRILEERTRQRMLEAAAQCRLLGGAPRSGARWRPCRCFGSDRAPGVAPQGAFWSRTMLPTVARWFVPDARETVDSCVQVRAALRCITPYVLA
jgi:hypothetical protein